MYSKFIAFIAFASFFLIIPLAGMNKYTQNQETIERQTYYNSECDKIDQELTTSFETLTIIMRSMPDKKRAINHLHKKIDFYVAQITERKQQILDEIKNEFKIKDAQWWSVLTFIKELKQYNEFHNQQKTPPKSTFTPDLCDTNHIIQGLLADNGIDPNKVIINCHHEQKINRYCDCLAESESPGATLNINKEYIDLLRPIQFDTGYITIYPGFFEYKKNIRQAILLHEVSHIALQHGGEDNILSSFINMKTNTKPNDLEKSPSWRRFMQIKEAETEIIPATQCHLYAYLLVKLRRKQYYPDCLFINHYERLKKILLYWELIALLKENSDIY
jgi:hypothetical protein